MCLRDLCVGGYKNTRNLMSKCHTFCTAYYFVACFIRMCSLALLSQVAWKEAVRTVCLYFVLVILCASYSAEVENIQSINSADTAEF